MRISTVRGLAARALAEAPRLAREAAPAAMLVVAGTTLPWSAPVAIALIAMAACRLTTPERTSPRRVSWLVLVIYALGAQLLGREPFDVLLMLVPGALALLSPYVVRRRFAGAPGLLRVQIAPVMIAAAAPLAQHSRAAGLAFLAAALAHDLFVTRTRDTETIEPAVEPALAATLAAVWVLGVVLVEEPSSAAAALAVSGGLASLLCALPSARPATALHRGLALLTFGGAIVVAIRHATAQLDLLALVVAGAVWLAVLRAQRSVRKHRHERPALGLYAGRAAAAALMVAGAGDSAPPLLVLGVAAEIGACVVAFAWRSAWGEGVKLGFELDTAQRVKLAPTSGGEPVWSVHTRLAEVHYDHTAVRTELDTSVPAWCVAMPWWFLIERTGDAARLPRAVRALLRRVVAIWPQRLMSGHLPFVTYTINVPGLRTEVRRSWSVAGALVAHAETLASPPYPPMADTAIPIRPSPTKGERA